MDQKDCRNWSRKDRLTALESQTMTFKSFDVGSKAGRCHKSEVLVAFTAGFFVMATSNTSNRTQQTAFSAGFFVILNFKELLLAVIWSFSLSVVGNSWVAAFEGSKSIKICQCNENLAVVDEWPLFRGAIIQEFHCIKSQGVFSVNSIFKKDMMFVDSKACIQVSQQTSENCHTQGVDGQRLCPHQGISRNW